MDIERQRELAAKFMEMTRRTEYHKPAPYAAHEYHCYFKDGEFYCFVDDWLPDLDVQQAAELKARLRELGHGYATGWTAWRGKYDCEIGLIGEEENEIITESDVSEEAALVAAVAEMQKGKDGT